MLVVIAILLLLILFAICGKLGSFFNFVAIMGLVSVIGFALLMFFGSHDPNSDYTPQENLAAEQRAREHLQHPYPNLEQPCLLPPVPPENYPAC